MAEIHGQAFWPGAEAVEACTYPVSHGVSPGIAVLKMSPQDVFPDMFGDLTITDGVEEVIIPDCRVDEVRVEQDDSGFFWSLTIADRRWRWRTLGALFGSYNQLDPHGKLIPWTIRSPGELAALCFDALGETNWRVELPPGLTQAAGAGLTRFLGAGQNFVATGVNPPITWDGVPPAQALQQVADLFGCRVVYRPLSDTILVVPTGIGNDLPSDESIARLGPTLKAPETPDAVGVIGAPVRYQLRLKLEAVGEEWDGSYRPINLLSYAPKAAGAVQINQVTAANPQDVPNVDYKLTLTDNKGNAHTVAFFDTIGVPMPDVYVGLAAAVKASADPQWGKVTATVVGGGTALQVQGNQQGYSFDLSGEAFLGPQTTPPATVTVVLTQKAVSPNVSWESSTPPLFPNVQATARLTYDDARRLAQKSVFRIYRISEGDVSGQGLINVPGYGRLLRRQQLILQDTQVDQIVPQANDGNITDRTTGRAITVNFYNGYSHDKPAAVYGSVANFLLNGVWYANAASNLNTPADSQVFVPFTVDPVWQQITFSNPVFYLDPSGKVKEPTLQLQTAVNVRNPLTNAVERFTKILVLPGFQTGTNPQWSHHEDCQLEVTSTYAVPGRTVRGGSSQLTLQSWQVLDLDAITRADYYLAGMAQQYVLGDGLTAEYNGIVAIDPDGAVQQVTWSVGGDGATTTASRNMEHHPFVPPYPARRRAEAVAADPVQQKANLKMRNPFGL